MPPSDDQFGLPAVAPENVTPGQLLLILQSMHGQLVEIRRQHAADRVKLDELTEAWNSAKGVVSLMKTFALVGGLVAACYGLWNGLINHIRGG